MKPPRRSHQPTEEPGPEAVSAPQAPAAPPREALELSAENYGPFWRYVSDDDVTDCDYNGIDLWITDITGRRHKVDDHGISQHFVNAFSQRVSNQVSKAFNKMNPLLEAETRTLRISIVHESAAVSGRSICLRKSLPTVRINARTIVDTDYLARPVLNLLVNCIQAKMNFVIGGEPGAGKTELAKFLTQFIPDEQRVITIEDSPEWHFREINPGHDCIEMRVDQEFSYSDAIKTCLRQNPKWIALSEARGEEAKWLITSWSTGVNGVTTIHTDDIRKIPPRLIAMMNDRNDAERMISDIYDFVNVAILVRRKAMPDGTAKRYVDQVGFLYRDQGEDRVLQLVRNGEFVSDELPRDIAFRLERSGVTHPYENREIDAALDDVPEPSPVTSDGEEEGTLPVVPPFDAAAAPTVPSAPRYGRVIDPEDSGEQLVLPRPNHARPQMIGETHG